MAGGLVAPAAALLVAAISGWGQLLVALPAVLAWAAAPLVAQRVSARLEPVELLADKGDLAELRLVARRTWGFFETFVTADQLHLPPDNFQEDPEPRIAHRTSPTNIGLYFLTVISARDFGWIGMTARRSIACRPPWPRPGTSNINTVTCTTGTTPRPAATEPRYVSSVDSGNPATCWCWPASPGVA